MSDPTDLAITIDDDVPLPPIPGRREPGIVSQAIRGLEVGQSAFAPKMTTASVGQAVSRAVKIAPGKQFTTRTVKGGVRIWRTA